MKYFTVFCSTLRIALFKRLSTPWTMVSLQYSWPKVKLPFCTLNVVMGFSVRIHDQDVRLISVNSHITMITFFLPQHRAQDYYPSYISAVLFAVLFTGEIRNTTCLLV